MAELTEEPKAGAPAWLVSFGDMMTLILTFFILLVSMATQRDFALMASGLGSFLVALKTHGMPGVMSASERAEVFNHYRVRFNLPPEPNPERREEHVLASDMELVRATVARALQPFDALFQPQVATFEPDSAELTPASRDYLDRLAPTLRPGRRQLLILEGHALDAGPLHGGQNPWLALARARGARVARGAPPHEARASRGARLGARNRPRGTRHAQRRCAADHAGDGSNRWIPGRWADEGRSMMADQQKEAPAEAKPAQAAAPKGKKKGLVLGGGALVLVALAYLAALVAVPRKFATHDFVTQLVAPLTGGKVQVNLSDGKSFLILDLNMVYDAYDVAYYESRSADPLYRAELRDVLVAIASAKTRAEVSDKVNKPVFMEEIRSAVEPLLFPVHIGATSAPAGADPESGLAPGASSHVATFRGVFHEHVLHVDGVAHTLQIDSGPLTPFSGDETDLPVAADGGLALYVDVSGLKPGFKGDLPVGVKGRLRRVLWNEVLIQ